MRRESHPADHLCRTVVLDGEVHAGEEFLRPIGPGLAFWMQPIHSGWILRVIPASGPRGAFDYAELATPPYNSPTPLSLSTDFGFRAQDAAGWNPRRFRYAPTRVLFEQLLQAHAPMADRAARPTAGQQARLASLLAGALDGDFIIKDVRLIPGSADQSSMAAPLAEHFNSTAHTLDLPAQGKDTPLGALEWVRFQLRLDLPGGRSQASDAPERSLPCTHRVGGGDDALHGRAKDRQAIGTWGANRQGR